MCPLVADRLTIVEGELVSAINISAVPIRPVDPLAVEGDAARKRDAVSWVTVAEDLKVTTIKISETEREDIN